MRKGCLLCNQPQGDDEIEVFSGDTWLHGVCSELIRSVRAMQLDDLPEDVQDEVIDIKFPGRTHGKRATYAQGCRGPLCRKAERDRGWQRSRVASSLPPTDDAPETKARARDTELNRYLAWHWFTRREEADKLKIG